MEHRFEMLGLLLYVPMYPFCARLAEIHREVISVAHFVTTDSMLNVVYQLAQP